MILLNRAPHEFIVAFPPGANIHVEDVRVAVMHFVLIEHRMLCGVHAADLRAILNSLSGVARTGAGDEHNFFWYSSVGWTARFSKRRAGSGEKAFKLQPGQNVFVSAVTIFRKEGCLLDVEAGRNDNGTNLDVDHLILLVEVDRVRRAFGLAEFAFAVLEVRASCPVNDRLIRNSLRERNIDCAAQAEPRIELARNFLDGARRCALAAAGACPLVDALCLLPDACRKIADETGKAFHFCIGVERDVRMLRDFHHPRRQDALRTVKRWERLRQLGHMSADGRIVLDQDDFLSGVGDVERSLNAGDPSADHQRRFRDGDFDGKEGPVPLHFFHHH